MNRIEGRNDYGRRVAAWLAGALFVGAAGCAPAALTTPDGMIEVNEPTASVYDYRATTPHGIVVAARQIRQREGTDVPPGDLAFWAEATRLRLRTSAGYALIEEETVRSVDGTEGLRMQFGRDQSTTPYRYDVLLFVTPRFIHFVEAGGETAKFEEAEALIEEALASYRIRR